MENNIYKKLFEVKKAGIKLQRDTKAFNYKYATLSQIQEKFGEELQKQRLVIIHNCWDNEVITTIHDLDSDTYVKSCIQMSEGTKPQDKGSEITYYRRYNLLSLLDLEVEDDDGKKAQDSIKKEYTNTDHLEWIADKNIETLRGLISEGKTFTLKDIREKYKVSKANADILSSIGIK